MRILEIKEPNHIKIVDITYGNRTNGGYWTTINHYCDDFISKVVLTELKNIANK